MMAKEPNDLVLRLLREIRAKQDAQGTTLEAVQKRVEDLYKMSTHTLGVGARAHEPRMDKLSNRVRRLEAKA